MLALRILSWLLQLPKRILGDRFIEPLRLEVAPRADSSEPLVSGTEAVRSPGLSGRVLLFHKRQHHKVVFR